MWWLSMPVDGRKFIEDAYRSQLMQVVGEYLDEGTFNRQLAADALLSWTRYCRERHRPVDLPPIFAELLAEALTGNLEKKRGRRSSTPWKARVIAARKFMASRHGADPGTYDADLIRFAEAWGVKETTFKEWVKSEKDANS